LNVSKEFAKDIVKKACIVLHNIVRENYGFHVEEEFVIRGNRGLMELQRAPLHNRGERNANHVREQLAKYFMSPVGALPWQINKI